MQLEGYSYEEIAEKLGMTVKNVSVRLVRVKKNEKSICHIMKKTLTNEEFDSLWQRAEVEGYASQLSKEYPAWRTRQRRITGMASVTLVAAMIAVAVPMLPAGHSGYGKVYSNREGIAETQWVNLASEMLLDA
ncbi:MAG: sigma-70 region 4 domain-containing protein [Bacteroidales bacterium]|nr:sigma-70 region 4 domain-containing protein [Bacteroidales bacterium]